MGAQGLRDRGALEAALGRPQSGYYRDIIEQAAALLESLTSGQHGSRASARSTGTGQALRYFHRCGLLPRRPTFRQVRKEQAIDRGEEALNDSLYLLYTEGHKL